MNHTVVDDGRASRIPQLRPTRPPAAGRGRRPPGVLVRNCGRPPPSSVTSTRTRSPNRSTCTVNGVPPCWTALAASSDTSRPTVSRAWGPMSASRSPTQRRAPLTDVVRDGKTRRAPSAPWSASVPAVSPLRSTAGGHSTPRPCAPGRPAGGLLSPVRVEPRDASLPDGGTVSPETSPGESLGARLQIDPAADDRRRWSSSASSTRTPRPCRRRPSTTHVAGVETIHLEVTGLDFIDSSGLRVLVEAHRTLGGDPARCAWPGCRPRSCACWR